MINWQRVETVIGETAGEVGVLVVVFAPLEATFSEVSVSSGRVTAMFVFGLLLLAGGVMLKVRK